MKNILVLISPEEDHESAVNFAEAMAKINNYNIMLGYFDFLEGATGAEIVSIEEMPAQVVQALQTICSSIRAQISNSGQKLTCEIIASRGSTEACLSFICNNVDPAFLIMQRKDAASSFSTLGNTTRHAIHALTYPVLLLKQRTPWKKIQSIYLALENPKEGIADVQALVPMAKWFEAVITILHIDCSHAEQCMFSYHDEHSTDPASHLVEIRKAVGYPRIGAFHLKGKDLMHDLTMILKTAHPDMIAITKSPQESYSPQVHQSVTEMLLRNSDAPILVMHKNDHLIEH